MRIVFFGSGDFAVPGLQALHLDGQELALVVTQPERPAGRGGQTRATPVQEAATALDLPCYHPPSLKPPEVAERLCATAPDLCVIIAYGGWVTPELLAIPPHGFINAHASLLPKYRGAAPVPHAILNGESATGVTIFRLEPAWDSGPVYRTVTTPIRGHDTSATVLQRLAPLAAGALVEVVRGLETGTLPAHPQAHGKATLAPKLRREDGRLDWSESAERIDCRVRAFQPWPEAFTTMPAKRGKTRRLQVLGVEREPFRDPQAATARPGEVLVADPREGLVVAAGDGTALRLTSIKPEGKRAMTGAAFLRGARLEPGTRLGEEGQGERPAKRS